MAFPERTLNTQELGETKRKSRDRRGGRECRIYCPKKQFSSSEHKHFGGHNRDNDRTQSLLAGCTPYVHCFLRLSLYFTGGEAEAQRGERAPRVTSLLGPLSAQLPRRLDLPLWLSRRRPRCHRRCAHTYPRASFL